MAYASLESLMLSGGIKMYEANQSYRQGDVIALESVLRFPTAEEVASAIDRLCFPNANEIVVAIGRIQSGVYSLEGLTACYEITGT